MKDATLAIHAGFQCDPVTKSVAVPIYQNVAYELTVHSMPPICLIWKYRVTFTAA